MKINTSYFLKENMGIIWVIFISFFFTFSCQPSEAKIYKKEITPKIHGLSIPFIQNTGITNKKVAFFANTFKGTVFLTNDKTIVYSFPANFVASGKKNFAKRFVVRESFCRAGLNGSLKGEDETTNRITFINWKKPGNWNKGIKAFNRIDFGDVCPGITLSLKAYANNVEKIFTVAPGRNPSDIRVEVAGVQKLDVDKQGELLFVSSLGSLVLSRPIAYQIVNDKKSFVTASYTLHDSGYSFRVGDYDRTKPLYIDPIISATFLGGSDNPVIDDTGWDIANDIVVDNSGYVYVVGETQSADFPTTVGVINTNYNDSDGFISKFNPDLTQLIVSTFIGGNGSDEVTNIIIDKQTNNILIAGTTSSSNFPTTEGAYDSYLAPGSDKVFVCRLSNDLSSVINSTLLGGTSSSVHALSLDNEGNIFVAGEAFGYTEDYPNWTSDFPVTTGTYDTSYNGASSDGFISKFNPNLTELMASTFLGGNGIDQINSIAIEQDGKVFVAGYTSSDDFPVTPGAYQSTKLADQSGFISTFSPDLSTLYASTYLGGSSSSDIAAIVIGPEGNIFATGTAGPGFPTTQGAIQPEFNDNGEANGFISKINPNLTQLLASTYISKGGVIVGTNLYDLALGNGGTLYVVGDPMAGGESDALIVRVNLNLTRLMGMIQFGGQGDTDLDSRDSATAMDIGPDGTIYTTGYTYSQYFPVTENTYDISFNGLCDAFVARFDRELNPAIYYKLTIDPEPQNGRIQVPDEEEIIPSDSTVTLQAIPNEGYILYGWEGDCSVCSVNLNCTITMDSDKTCTANFEPIPNEPPVIESFTAELTSGDAPLEVSFTCEAYDPDGEIVSYAWDFDGDGMIDETSETGSISHTYANPGTYHPTCTVTDNDGESATSEAQEITVNEAVSSWMDITDTLNITHSTRQLYDRIHRCFFIQVTVENPGDALSGPIRLVITDPSIPVKTGVEVGLEPDGYTEDGDPYFIIVPEEGNLDAGEILRNMRINFELQRKHLTYGIRIEQLGQ